MFRACVLHRLWLLAVVAATAAAFVPRALQATDRNSKIGRVAGVVGADGAGPNEFGDTRFRWVKRIAALQEPIYGRTMQIPLYVGRPGIETEPLMLRVRVSGKKTPGVLLQRPGWFTLSLDLATLLGEPEWRTAPSVRIAFDFDLADSRSSAEVGLPGVGIGQPHWSGPAPR